MQYSIPGGKDCGNRWDATRTDGLRRLGYTRSPADPSAYVRDPGTSNRVIIVTVVDDFIVTGATTQVVTTAKKELCNLWEMDDQGQLRWCLNLSIHRNRPTGSLTIDQEQYIQDVLHRFNMKACKPAPTPAPAGKVLTPMGPDKQSEEVELLPYRQLTGALLYLRLTRPDILVPVTMGANHAKKWSRQAWKRLKYICRYLRGTSSLGLRYEAKKNISSKKIHLEAWVDADYATDPETRVSRTGYFTFMNKDCLVAFGLRLQKGTPSTGTCEAEYRALAAAVKELIWVYMIIRSFGFEVELPMKVYEDNQASERLAKDYSCQKRSKHIDVRFHYVTRNGHFICYI